MKRAERMEIRHPDSRAIDEREPAWTVDRNETSIYVWFPKRSEMWLYLDGGAAPGGLAVIAERITDPAQIISMKILVMQGEADEQA